MPEKSNFRHRSTNSTRPNHPKRLAFWLFSRRAAKSPTFDKFRHAVILPTPHIASSTPTRRLVTRNEIIHRLRFEKALKRIVMRNGIILGERFKEPQAVSELRIEFGCEIELFEQACKPCEFSISPKVCEGSGRRPSAVRNEIIHRLRFEKALQLLTKRMESLAAELHCLSAARHEFAIQPKDCE